VTGGAGFLGSYVCEALLVGAFEVVCVDHFATSSAHNIETLIAEPQFSVIWTRRCGDLPR